MILTPLFTPMAQKLKKVKGAAYCQTKNKYVVKSDEIKLKPNNTIFQAEAVALLECLLFIKSLDCILTTIFSDSQSVLKAITSFNTDPIITEIQKVYGTISKTRHIVFYWCPGHVNILGNKCADQFAKSAVEKGRTPSISVDLPISHAEMVLTQKITELWKTSSTNSTNGRTTFKFVPDITRNPFAHFNLHYKLTAILTGHGKFNMYRQQYDHTLSAYCECKTALDTINHYIFHYPLYSADREELPSSIKSLTIFPSNSIDLISNPLIFYHLNSFITNTNKLNH